MVILPKWKKKGLIYVRNSGDFFKSHTTRPIPFLRRDGVLRLYISSRCADDMMHPTYIDIDPENPSEILGVCEYPLLDIGTHGLFDDSGIVLCSILKTSKGDYIYYVGWKRRRYGIPFETSIGVARIIEDGNRLEKLYLGPILAQDILHPYLVAGPFVVKDRTGAFRMWYCSGTEWKQRDHGFEPIYTVYHALSEDGIRWMRKPVDALVHYKYNGEVITAPWVVRTTTSYLMYYSFRGSENKETKNYTIGVAISSDGILWSRSDSDAGLGKSSTGWDSEMICYPSIFNYGDKTYLFYSGNAVGKDGIGYAVADKKLDIIDW
uniref:Glycosyl hydrolases family 43 n=1 Tax=Candidatus Kentrum sp. LFY TaxID=2126342 RepID=A0A450UPK5_9GAMM|nr:MAG: hypothetical protein BECKLFY1418A_GA0070994_104023 [Candidatus Kentron sp. LFY]